MYAKQLNFKPIPVVTFNCRPNCVSGLFDWKLRCFKNYFIECVMYLGESNETNQRKIKKF